MTDSTRRPAPPAEKPVDKGGAKENTKTIGAAAGAFLRALSADLAPTIAAALSFMAGVATLLATASPASHSRAIDALTLIASEAPSLFAALVGLAQMAIADGLRRRVDAAMWAATALSTAAAAYFVLHHERYFDAFLQFGFAAFLVIYRRAFYRRARAFSRRIPPAWIIAIGAAIGAAGVAAILWSASHPNFVAAPFSSVVLDPVLGRAGRPVALAGGAFALFLFWRLVATVSRSTPPAPAADEFARASAVLKSADAARPEALLAFTGDLSLLFSPSGESFIPYASYRSGMFALGGPVGRADEQRALLAQFCEDANRQGLKPVVYAAAASMLPTLIDLGFKIEKIGENAVIPLEHFSLAGKAMQNLRYANRKLTSRDGAHFEMRAPPHDAALIERLRPVSNAWLANQKTEEKRFSLGRFDHAFLNHCFIAQATIGERTIAFGSVLATPDGKWAALDLMRYDQTISPPGTMDFLLSEILLWAKEARFSSFDLSMAPLSGLDESPQAHLFARLGRLIYEKGGRWYNFEGLRRFKEKFYPEWEPRYIAAKGAFAAPVALAEIAMLTNSSPDDALKSVHSETAR